MQSIHKWYDIKPFLNQIVAYTTTSNRFGLNRGYQIYPNSTIKFGYIFGKISQNIYGINLNTLKHEQIKQLMSDTYDYENPYYRLIPILNPDDVNGDLSITNDDLEIGNLNMRLATNDEANLIIKMIDEGKCEFSYEGGTYSIFGRISLNRLAQQK